MFKKICAMMAVCLLVACGGGETSKTPLVSNVNAPNKDYYVVSNTVKNSDMVMQYNATVELAVKARDTARAQITTHVDALNGWVLDDTEKLMVVAVPSADLDNFLKFLGDDIGQIKSQKKSARDVSVVFKDIDAKLESLKFARDKYSSMMAKTKDVSQVLMIEKELERISAEIKRLELQKSHTTADVEYTQVTITFRDYVWKTGVALSWIGLLGLVLALVL